LSKGKEWETEKLQLEMEKKKADRWPVQAAHLEERVIIVAGEWKRVTKKRACGVNEVTGEPIKKNTRARIWDHRQKL